MEQENASDYQIGDSKENESSFENSECIKKEKKIKLKLKKERIYKQKNHGSWSDKEEFKFSEFMIAHRKIFEQKESRRTNKIFRQMAKHLCSRSSEQCRTHRQKYELRFLEFDKIIDHIRCKIGMKSTRNVLRENQPEIKTEPHEVNYWYANFQKTEAFVEEPEHFYPFERKKNKELPTTIIQPVESMLQQTMGYQVIEKQPNQIEIIVNMEVFFE